MRIVDFLLARIAEDEALATAANIDRSGKPYDAKWWGFADDVLNAYSDTHDAQNEYIHRFVPSRILAESQAKRAIVEYRAGIRWPSEEAHDAVRNERDRTLRLLAAVYADHPDYQLEWTP